MDKEFVTYEIANQLVDFGFDNNVIAAYETFDNNKLSIFAFSIPNKGVFEHGFNNGWCIKAPLWQQAIDWFREEHNIVICIYANASGFLYELHKTIGGSHIFDSGLTGSNEGGAWDSYYTARENAILKAIELCQNGK